MNGLTFSDRSLPSSRNVQGDSPMSRWEIMSVGAGLPEKPPFQATRKGGKWRVVHCGMFMTVVCVSKEG